MDELIVFDMSQGDEEHEAALELLKEICAMAQMDVTGAGNIQHMEDVKKLLTDSGVPEEKMETFEEKFTENVGESHKLVADNIANVRKFELKTPDVTIQVNPGRTDLIDTRVIDGIPCIVIECNDQVEVNGIRVANPQ